MIHTDARAWRVFRRVSALRHQYGVAGVALALVWLFVSRLLGSTVLACVHKTVGPVGQSAARRLDEREIEMASNKAELELQPAFVASASGSQCYGVVTDHEVRSYAWTSVHGPVWVLPGATVSMPDDTVYVYKAFTDPAFRGRGYLQECLLAIENAAAQDGRRMMSALIELHNQSSLRGFRRAGFTRCGFVLLVRRPWLVKRIGCRCSAQCSWQAEHSAAIAPPGR